MVKFTYWCPFCKMKQVTSQNNPHREDRFKCLHCRRRYTIEQLAATNNIQRVVHQRELRAMAFSPKMKEGMNEW